MSETEFFDEAKKRGLREDNVRSAIANYHLMKKELPNLVLDETIIECALKAQEKSDSEPDDIITVD